MTINSKLAITILAVAAFTLYGMTLGWDFVFDDITIIIDNEKMKSLDFLADFFLGGMWHTTALLKQISVDYYRPLHMSFLALNYQLWGGSPTGFHAVNILIHAVNSILLYFIAKSLLADETNIYSFLGALLFVVHPIHVESISWISGSSDLLLTFFILSSLLMYMHSASNDSAASGVFSVVFFICALLTKEVAIVFPIIICAYDLLVNKRARYGRWLLYLIIASGYLVIRSMVLREFKMGIFSMNQEGFVRLFEYICGYIQLSIWPYPISLHQGAQHFGITVYIFAIIAFSGMLIFALKDRRRMFLFIWYFAFIAFPLTLAFVTQNDLKFYFADRYLYIPSVSIAILFSFLLQKLFNSRQKIMLLAIIPVFLILAVITVQASMDWQNNSTLFSTLVKKHPERMDNYRQVGEFYERHGQATKAIEEYKNALNNLHLNEDKAAIFNNMGRTYGMNGQPENAIYAFKMALLLQPLNSTALIGLGNNSSDYAQASYYYSKALETDRSNYTACNNLMRLNEVNGYQDKVEYYKQKCSSLQKGYSVNLELPLQK